MSSPMLLRRCQGAHLDTVLDFSLSPTFGLLELIHLNLVVEMADVANDGLIFHREHVRGGDDVTVAGRGDVIDFC